MSRFHATVRFAWSRRGLAVWVGALGVIVSVASCVSLFRRDRAHEQTRFQLLGNERVHAIQAEIDRPLQSLTSAGLVFAGPDRNQSHRAERFARSIMREFPQVTSVHLGRVANRHGADTELLIDHSWTNGSPNCLTQEFHGQTKSDSLNAGQRPFQVRFQRSRLPFDAGDNCLLIGTRLERSGARSVEASDFADGEMASATTQVLAIMIDVDGAMTRALDRLMPTGIQFVLSSQTDKLAGMTPGDANRLVAELRATTDADRLEAPLKIADRAQRLTAVAPTGGFGERSSELPWVTLFAGLFVSGTLATYVASIAGRAAKVERLVERRTRQLETANRRLSEEIGQRTEVEASLVTYAQELESTNTTLEATRDRMKETLDELEVRNQELDEFNYIASHDLQEPVRKLISFSMLLKQDAGDELSEVAMQDLHYIVDSAQRMRQLIRDLLAFSRTGRSALKIESIDLNEAAQAAIDSLLLKIDETGAEVSMDSLGEIEGDFTLITQLFQNLISNALKFCEQSQPIVHLSANRVDDELQISVRDNGIGIRNKYLEQIFQPFQRLNGRSQYEGNGIGLAICRKAASRLGGRIWVESEVGFGSTFFVSLPVSNGKLAVTEAPDVGGRQREDDATAPAQTSAAKDVQPIESKQEQLTTLTKPLSLDDCDDEAVESLKELDSVVRTVMTSEAVASPASPSVES